MELQENKSFERGKVPIRKKCHIVDNDFSSSPQKDEIKIKIKCGKVVNHTESNRCVQAAGIDTHPDQAVKDIEIDVPETAISATLTDSSSFTDNGEGATVKDKLSSNVSRFSTSKVSPSLEKNDLKIKIKCGKIVQSSIEKVPKVTEGSKHGQVSAQIGLNTEVGLEVHSEGNVKVAGTSSGIWNSPGWKKKNESKCGMPRFEQDSTHLGLLAPVKINPSLSVSVGEGEKAKSPTLREETDKVLRDGHCVLESNNGKTKISQRKPSKSIQPKASTKRQSIQPKASTKKQNKMCKRKSGSKLKRTLLILRRTCRKCLKKSSSFSVNINHEKLEHPHICQICNDSLFSFIDKKDLNHHKEIMHSVGVFEVASQKNLDIKTFVKALKTENFDNDDVIKMPKVSEPKSSGPKVMPEVDVPLRNSNETRRDDTFNQNMIKDDSQQTEQNENITAKPKKEVDLNKNETLPDDGKMKVIPLNNLIETGTYLLTKPTINEKGTSWKMEKIEECAKSADTGNHLETSQLHYAVPVTLSEGAASVINTVPTDKVFNVCSVNSQTQTTNHTASIPDPAAMFNPMDNSLSVKMETGCSAAIPKSVAIDMPGVNKSNLVQGGVAGVMRGNMRAGMMQPSMRGNMKNGMMQPPMRGNLSARLMQPTMRGGGGVKMRGGSAVPLVRGVRPRMQVGRGVVGMQGIRPPGVSGAPLRPLGVRRAHLGPSGVRGAPLKPSSVPRTPCRPQLLLRGNGGVGMVRVPGAPFPGGMRPQIKRKSGAPVGARPLGVQIEHRETQPGYHKQIQAQRVSMQPMVPDETSNLSTAFQPKIVKVETITLSDEESPPSASVNDVLDRLCGISVTRIKTSTTPKSLELPPGISLTPASMSFNSQSRRNGFTRGEVANSSYSITAVLEDPPK